MKKSALMSVGAAALLAGLVIGCEEKPAPAPAPTGGAKAPANPPANPAPATAPKTGS